MKKNGIVTQEVSVQININGIVDYLNDKIKTAIESSCKVTDCNFTDWDTDGNYIWTNGNYETECRITEYPETEYYPSDVDVEMDCECIPKDAFNSKLKELLPKELYDLLNVTIYEGDWDYESD